MLNRREKIIISILAFIIIIVILCITRYKIVGHKGAYIYRYDRWTGKSSVVFFNKRYNLPER